MNTTHSPTIDYDRVADLYDDYAHVSLDVPFFLNAARQATGDVLELMPGTGRVSLPLIQAGVRLTCVDRSVEMLTVLRRKLEPCQLVAEVYQMDVRELSLPRRYALAFISFHSLAELVSAEDQRQTLAKIHEHLAPDGQLICTLHNPTVRVQSVDGQPHLIGAHTRADGSGTLVAWIVYSAVIRGKVNDYFDSGRTVAYTGLATGGVPAMYHHHTLEDYLREFKWNGLCLTTLADVKPNPEQLRSGSPRPKQYYRFPYFMVLGLTKHTSVHP